MSMMFFFRPMDWGRRAFSLFRSLMRRPSWYFSPMPQARTAPVVVRAIAWLLPAATLVILFGVGISAGNLWIHTVGENVESPSTDCKKRLVIY